MTGKKFSVTRTARDEIIVTINLGHSTHTSALEFERAAQERPDNPAFAMRPIFHTGSAYGEEILALHGMEFKK
jgi:hypothetical protein